MNLPITKKWLFVALLGLILIFGAQYLLSFKKLTIEYSNVTQATIYAVGSQGIEQDSKPVKTIQSSGQTVKLRSGNYIIRYSAATDYESRDIAIILNQNQQSVSYQPYFSNNKLATMLVNEQQAIKQAITRDLPASNQYRVQPGKLYHLGDWYGTTLIYKGQDIFNTDTLRLVAHKENNTWVVKTIPPNISLSKYVYPDVPRDVLKSVNDLP